jgi:peptidoglycan/LPS O-acetylase OafA/YrhL
MSGGAETKYRPEIDGLRAVAVGAVVVFHAFPRLAPGGFLGVDVFFVISGFLISTIILKGLDSGSFTYAEFYGRRVRRIFPALVTVLAATLTIGWLTLTPEEYSQLGRHTAAGALYSSNLQLWSESGYFDSDAQAKPLLHLWSLGIEEQFYLLWPICLVRLRNRPAAIAGILAVSLLATLVLAETQPTAAFYSPFTRFWELLVGSLLAQLSFPPKDSGGFGRISSMLRSIPSRAGLRDAIAGFGLVAIAVAVWGQNGETTSQGWWALLPTCGAAAVIAAGPESFVNRWLLSNRAMVIIGLISYPLYLWHWPILVFLRQLDFESLPPMDRWVRLGALGLALGLAYLTYRGIEKRVRPARHAVPVLCFLMTIVLISGAAIVYTNGAEGRLSTLQREVARQARDSKSSIMADYRTEVCFLAPEQDGGAYGSDCTNLPTGMPSLLLWGDSYAASLYPGLRKVAHDERIGLAQLTAAACPPLPGYSTDVNPHCLSVNEHVLSWARQNKPRTVVLAAAWLRYPFDRVANTIAELFSASVKEVVVVGHLTLFPKPQPFLLIRKGFGDGPLPERILNPQLKELVSVDSKLREISLHAGAQFVSVLEKTCNAAGCIVAPGGRPEMLLAWDGGHLTQVGSDFVVRQILCPNSTACDPVASRR